MCGIQLTWAIFITGYISLTIYTIVCTTYTFTNYTQFDDSKKPKYMHMQEIKKKTSLHLPSDSYNSYEIIALFVCRTQYMQSVIFNIHSMQLPI